MFTNNQIAIINQFVNRNTSFEQCVVLYKRFGYLFENDIVQTLSQTNYINNQATLASDAQRALILSSGKSAYIRTIESTDEVCIIGTRRVDELDYNIPEHTIAFTIKDAERRGYLTKYTWKTMPDKNG